jgi:hypothetical protein
MSATSEMLDSKEDARYATSGAIHVPAGEGATSWFSGDTYTIKASEESTHGSLGLVPPAWGVERSALRRSCGSTRSSVW